jgi:thiamine kinase-like enzyme
LQQGSVRVSGRQTLESDWQRLQVSADALAAAHPGQRRTVQEIVGRLRRHLPDLPRLPLVPSHGAFQLGHILCDEHGSLCLCDFDSMTAADPLFDVAHFTADMVLLEARGRLQPGRAVALSGALQQAWFAAVPWGRRQRVLDWSVAGLLLHKLACRQDEHLRGDAAVRMGTVMQEALSRTRRLDS